MIEFKGLRENVRWVHPRDEMILVLKRLAEFAARAGVTVRITSLNDHSHQRADAATGKRESLHYSDYALDCQILKKNNSSPSMGQMDRLARYLKHQLPGGCYDIIGPRMPGHISHIHIEYDCRQRQTEHPVNA